MKRRITALFILLTLFINYTVVFADLMSHEEVVEKYLGDIVDSERIFKYDYSVKDDETGTEVLKNADAIMVVKTLDIMDNTEAGIFDEDSAIKLKDFAKLTLRLSYGDNKIYDKEYDRYKETEYITQIEAVKYILTILGYDAYLPENPEDVYYINQARKIGLLKGTEFVPQANLSRGNAALLAYNALTTELVEQSVYSDDYNKYEKKSNKTLLSEVFGAAIVKGCVTAQNKINLYSELDYEENKIEIDRAPYYYKENIYDDFLGKYVIALVKTEANERSNIIDIAISQDDETVSARFDDVELTQEQKLVCNGENSKVSISLNGLKCVNLNGRPVSPDEINYELLKGDGEIRFSKPANETSYSYAVIYKYVTTSLKAVSDFSKKIFFSGVRGGINGKDYIDFDDDTELLVFIDGKRMETSDLKEGMIASVMESENKSFVLINASSKTVKGNITRLTDKKIYIDDTPYAVSEYFGARGYEAKIGYSGTFCLDYCDRIVEFRSRSNDVIVYGFLMDVAKENKSIDEDIKIRVFTTNNKFEIFNLKDSLTFDGKNGVKSQTVYDEISLKKDELCHNPIRYRLDSNNRVVFLDTLDETQDDAGDKDSITYSYTFSGALNWTASASHTSLPGSSYNWNSSTPNFVIPTDLTAEEDYAYRSAPSYIMNENVTIMLYSADEYDSAKLLVEHKNFNRPGIYQEGYRYAMVYGVTEMLDENGERTLGLELLDGTQPPNFPLTTYQVLEEGIEHVKQLRPGDIIQLNVKTGKVLRDYKLIAKAEDFFDTPKDKCVEPYDGRAEVVGTITMVDTERGLVRIKSVIDDGSGTERTFYMTYNIQSLGLYYRATQKSYNISIYDIEPGDRVFCFGGVSLSRILVIR